MRVIKRTCYRHEVVVICVGHIKFAGGKLRIVRQIDAFISIRRGEDWIGEGERMERLILTHFDTQDHSFRKWIII